MNKHLHGISVLSVIAPEEFNDDEYCLPRRILEAEGAIIQVASTRPAKAHGMFGLMIEPDCTLEQVEPDMFQAVTIAGGSGSPRYLWKNEILQALVRAFHKGGKIVAAICLSPVVLAEAGLLKGLEATVYKSPKAIGRMQELGAIVIDSETVQVGRILTGRDPQAAEAYGQALARILRSELVMQAKDSR